MERLLLELVEAAEDLSDILHELEVRGVILSPNQETRWEDFTHTREKVKFFLIARENHGKTED